MGCGGHIQGMICVDSASSTTAAVDVLEVMATHEAYDRRLKCHGSSEKCLEQCPCSEKCLV